MERWLSSDAPLLRRLGIYALSKAGWLTSDERLRLLVERNLLFERDVGNEVRDLLREQAGSASVGMIVELLAVVDDGPPGLDDPLQADIARERVLRALRGAQVVPTEVDERLDQIATNHPELATAPEAEYPEVAITEWSGPRSPRTVEELLESDPNDAELLEFLISYDAHSWDESRDGLLGVLQVAAYRDFGWSMQLARKLAAQGLWDSDVWSRLIGGWSELSLAADEWRGLLEVSAEDTHKASQATDL